MAIQTISICDNCSHQISRWSDGNPYYLNLEGKKVYAYHPNHDELDKCIGNDSPGICLACSNEFMIDSLSPLNCCPKCESSSIIKLFDIYNKKCPFCHEGKFSIEKSGAIS